MAIAPYFQRTAMAASQVLQELDYDGLVRLLERHRIGLLLDGSAARSREGTATADLALRLLARFYPKLALVAADANAERELERLRELARSINPNISVTAGDKGVTHWLVIGKTAPPKVRAGSRVVYVGSSNWLVKLSMTKAVGSGFTKNPFAAGVAACLGVANLFRVVFAKQLPGATLDQEVMFSLRLLDRTPSKKAGQYQPNDIGSFYLVGAGAIGNGAIWALSRSGFRGELNVVDPQRLELSNMQRYVMAVMDDVEKTKTALVNKWLSSAKGLAVNPLTMTWDDFAGKSDWKFDQVLVALDTAEDRIGVQASLPRWVANAYTLNSGIGVSRHHFSNSNACLACVYLPSGQVPSEDVLIASALGLQATPPSQDLIEVRRRLERNEPCERAFLATIAARTGKPLENLLPFENRTLREFYQNGICGGQVVGMEVDGRESRAEVPMAFQSAMAGVLLAAELALEIEGARGEQFPTVSRIDLHKALPEDVSRPRGKDPLGRCICQDQDYILAYNEKYGVAQ